MKECLQNLYLFRVSRCSQLFHGLSAFRTLRWRDEEVVGPFRVAFGKKRALDRSRDVFYRSMAVVPPTLGQLYHA